MIHLSKIVKWAATLVIPLVAYGYGSEAFRLVKLTSLRSQRLQWFLFGVTLFTIIWVFLRHRMGFIVCLEHEFTHLLVGLLFLKAPHSFYASREGGGMVRLQGNNVIIQLAPYYLPTYSYLLLLIGIPFRRDYAPLLLFLLGFTAAYHVLSTWGEIHSGQSDLQDAGLLYCWIFLPVANLVVFGALWAFVIKDYSGFTSYWGNGVTEIIKLFDMMIIQLHSM